MANTQYPSASISITFVTAMAGAVTDNGILKAEIKAKDNGGRSQFLFSGAAPKFRLYKSPNVSNIQMFVSDGNSPTKISGNVSTDDIVEALTFAGAASLDSDGNVDGTDISYRQSDVSYPVYGSPTVENIKGNNGFGSVALLETGFTTFQCSGTSDGPTDPVVGFCRVTYNSKYDLYELTGVTAPSGFGSNGFTEYTVIVYIVGEVS